MRMSEQTDLPFRRNLYKKIIPLLLPPPYHALGEILLTTIIFNPDYQASASFDDNHDIYSHE